MTGKNLRPHNASKESRKGSLTKRDTLLVESYFFVTWEQRWYEALPVAKTEDVAEWVEVWLVPFYYVGRTLVQVRNARLNLEDKVTTAEDEEVRLLYLLTADHEALDVLRVLTYKIILCLHVDLHSVDFVEG